MATKSKAKQVETLTTITVGGVQLQLDQAQFESLKSQVLEKTFPHGIDFKESTAIKAMSYNPTNQTLKVRFPSGDEYEYLGITWDDFTHLSDGDEESLGRRFNAWKAKRKPEFVKLTGQSKQEAPDRSAPAGENLSPKQLAIELLSRGQFTVFKEVQDLEGKPVSAMWQRHIEQAKTKQGIARYAFIVMISKHDGSDFAYVSAPDKVQAEFTRAYLERVSDLSLLSSLL